jgi:L-seryl-tRNA(Ser) seleniumtransferase
MPTYIDLGIRPFINASGTITTLGGSLMAPEVLDAMRAAAAAFVDLNALNIKAGECLAQMIGVDAAHVSAGAASGMQLAAAACLTGSDEERICKLPFTEGWKNEFVISKVDRHTYIHQGIEICGGKLVRVGSDASVATAQIMAGVGERTAAIVHFLGKQTKEQLAEVIAGARPLGVPVIVDAAAQLPPRSNLTELTAMGASLVVFSGGKGMRGPQCTGLVVGQREFVEAVRLNASPFSSAGRGMKVGKEEIFGLIAAVELFLAGSDEEDRECWEKRSARIVEALDGLPDIKAYVVRDEQPASPQFTPRA